MSAGYDVTDLTSIPLCEIEDARRRLLGHVVRTPLVRFNYEVPGVEIYLKLENLQETGSFKQRGAANALLCQTPEILAEGVFCPSAGNFAQGVAYMATRLGMRSTIIFPDTAPETKLSAIRRYGGTLVKVPYDTWWKTMTSQHFEGIQGQFLHPVCNRQVIAGNATIGLEIMEDLPDVDVIMTPFGGGGLSIGVASAVKAVRPEVSVVACEVATAAPLTYSRRMGAPSVLPDHVSSFVDGMGGKSVFPEIWSLAQNLIDDTVTLTLDQIAYAIRLLLSRNRILAEGAGAAPVAAAMASGEHAGKKKVVAVVSGGNIDMDRVCQILNGQTPQ